ncbi:hypothetical protein [Paracoccus shanxieyensis]|uniref:Uncharacterized protein n=1 Tax=Paracoccus shanxieyensis TaxID=2675752 RepID=A0A6L6IY30_9RHOB|nr:hypothetical protein [Paracoccus shanxieyensis]MTH64511.1 hypothetical protein [Paracoccus shanxieyensis]MTH87496.1 hypothetical protein [Paracoccus shanxieyensis]
MRSVPRLRLQGGTDQALALRCAAVLKPDLSPGDPAEGAPDAPVMRPAAEILGEIGATSGRLGKYGFAGCGLWSQDRFGVGRQCVE